MIEIDPSIPIPIVEIPTPATPDDLMKIASTMAEGQQYDVRIQQLGRILDFPEYPININLNTQSLSSGKLAISASELEVSILDVLAGKPDTVLTREEILFRAWGEDCTNTPHVVDVHNSALKKKVINYLLIPYPIRNIRGVGFVFDSKPCINIT